MSQPSIVIIDYGVGNTHSVRNAIAALGYKRIGISSQTQAISTANALVLPGVGAFEACMHNLRNRNLVQVLNEAVLVNQIPILGICAGMQLMANFSEEHGVHSGLGWIPGRVVRLDLPSSVAVPHVGWNDLQILQANPLFSRTDKAPHFYFDHSYHYQCSPEFVVATTYYSEPITAAISYNNIYGVQFHPEKSQTNGLKLIRGFLNAVLKC